MNISEKREKVSHYCNSVDCEKCVLEVGGWSKPLNKSYKSCLNIADAPEKDLDRAISLIKEKLNSEDSTDEKNNIITIANNNSWVDLVGILLNNGYEVKIRPTEDYKHLEIMYLEIMYHTRNNETEG